MPTELTVTELVRNFADYINRVVYRGERFVILRSNKPVGELRPPPSGRRLGDLPAILNSLPSLSDSELGDFARDIETARREMAVKPVRDPWASS